MGWGGSCGDRRNSNSDTTPERVFATDGGTHSNFLFRATDPRKSRHSIGGRPSPQR